ncbi:hypothetical protein diail_7202 [Diaporthe ilicicola]|nr:hypothetical protein diail_7202 [Diaporthe ilicicola]
MFSYHVNILSLFHAATFGAVVAALSAPSGYALNHRAKPRLLSGVQASQEPSLHSRSGMLNNTTSSCRCIPGDLCWPTQHNWDALNSTVSGRLHATVPIANVCHGSSFDSSACDILKDKWSYAETHLFSGGEFDAPYFQNQSCDPYTPVDTPCDLGNYPTYFINVSSADDVVAGIGFATENNIRLIVKNTGHDFFGKSSGKGALSLWTSNLKEKSFITNYNGSKSYSGPAIKLGAGIIFSEAYEFANDHGHAIVGGSCATVGVSGGFSQGGGHGPLMSHYGMGADNVLEWEVVMPNGKLVTALPHGEFSDLYWALSGGGPGTWGVVISMTTRAHPSVPVGGASLTVPLTGLSNDTYWDAVATFMEKSTEIVANGSYMTVTVTDELFYLWGLTAPNKTAQEANEQLSPYVQYLKSANITYTLETTFYDNIYTHMDRYFGPFPFGVTPTAQVTGGRLLSRDILHNRSAIDNLTNTLRSKALPSGHFYAAFNFFDLQSTETAIESHRGSSQNSVLPAWTDSLASMIVVGPWDFTIDRAEMIARQEELTDIVMPAVREATPGGYAYLNEANFEEPDWQNTFYGENYDRLSSIKTRVDPGGLLYGRTAVGSEKWAEDSEGRLCRV